jgi:hypothetical protein
MCVAQAHRSFEVLRHASRNILDAYSMDIVKDLLMHTNKIYPTCMESNLVPIACACGAGATVVGSCYACKYFYKKFKQE